MDYNALNNLIDAYIYPNGVQAITGSILNNVLKTMVSQLGDGYHLMGVAAPNTSPAVNDFAMAYFAATAGTYTNFNGAVLAAGEVAVLLTSGNGSWSKQTIYNVPTGTADLANTAGFITSAVNSLVNYYTKTEIDTALSGYTTTAALATALADYYNKSAIDAQMATRYTKSEVDTKLADYYKKTETYDKDEVDSIVAALSRQEYIVAWDGLAAPDVSVIPAGVPVSYSGTTYTGTLAASASTVNKIYMVWNGYAYDMYATSQDGGYSWVPMGTTNVDLSQYATKTEILQLDSEIRDINGEIEGTVQNYADGGWGQTGENAGSSAWYRVMDYIPVSPGDTIVWNPGEVSGWISLIVYDFAKVYSAYFGANTTERTLIMPEGAAFIRPSFAKSTFSSAKIIRNGATVWHPVENSPGLVPKEDVFEIAIPFNIDQTITTGGTIGATISLDKNIEAGWDCAIVPCKKGDCITINGRGGNLTRLWAFVDSNLVVLDVSGANMLENNVEHYAPINSAYCIINTAHGYPASYYLSETAVMANIKDINSRTMNNYFVGNANTWSAISLKLLPGSRYRVYLFDTDWDMTGVTVTESYRFQIYSRYNGTSTSLAYCAAGDAAAPYYDIIVPSNSDSVFIGGRASLGTAVRFSINESSGNVSKQDLVANAFSSPYNETDIDSKSHEFSAMLNGGACEIFAFMTDPHLLGSSGVFNQSTFKQYIGLLLKYYNETPVDWMICGGDWLNNGDTQAEACWKLGYMDATMRKLFKSYFPVLGNHDTNYQGVVSSDDSSRGDLTHQAMVNLMFRENGNTYYKFKGNNTQFYVFDTGIDWETAMDSFKWEQINWFANALIEDDAAHTVIIQHIFYTYGTSVNPMAANIQAVAGAYNSRTTLTLNGITYNFAGCTGKIACVVAGHSHADAIITQDVSVPVWLTTNMTDGNTPTFDLCIIDYTAGKMKSVRVGTGVNREMNLA